MKLRTKKADPVWIKVAIDKEGREEAEVFVDPLSPQDIMDIKKRFTQSIWVNGEREEILDKKACADEIWRRMIRDWKAVEDEDGNPLPCSDENKISIADHNPDFVLNVMRRAERAGLDRREKLEKNSKGGGSGIHSQGK